MYLGFDPGRDKCGVAVVNGQGQAVYHAVIPAGEITNLLPHLCQQWTVTQVVMGDRTTARQWQTQLQDVLPQLPIHLVDEHNSTLEARDLYWQMYPARGWQVLIPQGMRLPPRPIDDLVAILLVQRYLQISTAHHQSLVE